MQVWDRVQPCKGHQRIHHGQEEGSNHQEAPPHDEDILLILFCDMLCVLILPNVLQICSDGPLRSADFWQQPQRMMLSVDDVWPSLVARLLCRQVIPGTPKQQWTMLTQSHCKVAARLRGNSIAQAAGLHVSPNAKHHVAGLRLLVHLDDVFNNVLQRGLHESEHVQAWKMHVTSLTFQLKTLNSSSQQALLPVLTDNPTTFSSQPRWY